MIQAPRVIRIEATWGLKGQNSHYPTLRHAIKKDSDDLQIRDWGKTYNNCSHKQKMDRQISAESPFTSAKGLKPLLPVRIIKNI